MYKTTSRRALFYRIMAVLPLLLGQVALAAGFDCGKARQPMEQAICNSPVLSDADQALNTSYGFLLSQCQDQLDFDNLVVSQRAWLAESRSLFRVHGGDAVKALTEHYAQRNAVLGEHVSRCAQAQHIAAPVIVKTVHADPSNASFPFVETVPPAIGRRINDWIFNRFLNMQAPTSTDQPLTGIPAELTEAPMPPMSFFSYFVSRNDGRLLALEITFEGCVAYCETGTDSFIFDVHSGRRVQSEDIFTIDGATTLANKLKAKRLERAKAILADGVKNNSMDDDERQTYQRCIDEWTELQVSLNYWSVGILPDGRWRFDPGRCSAHVNRPQDALDSLTETLSPAELRSYLNPYGRSLLLGEGDVRTPVPESLNCKDGIKLSVKDIAQPNGKLPTLSIGGSRFLLLGKDGRIWDWLNGANVQPGSNVEGWSLIGENFIQAAAGQDFYAGLRRDGSLWTWGRSYQGRLGAGSVVRSPSPGKIGENFTAVMLSQNGGMALDRNGAVWTWGGKVIRNGMYQQDEFYTTPRVLVTEVVQMQFGFGEQKLVLKKNGSVWAWSDYPMGSPPKLTDEPTRIGDGFTRLALPGSNLAFKADGSLWAWGETLKGFFGYQDNPELQARKIGSDFVTVGIGKSTTAALKADGSLWAIHARGETTGLEPVGCGYIDVVTAYGSTDSNLLALRKDGSLVVWDDAERPLDPLLFTTQPILVGNDFVKLYPVSQPWGGPAYSVLAVKKDGSLWLWSELQDIKASSHKERLQKLVLPGGS